MWQSDSVLQLAKGSSDALGAIRKSYKYPLEQIACRNPQIACNADHVGNILLGKINLNKKWRQFENSVYRPLILYT
jgi:hypothetical protein